MTEIITKIKELNSRITSMLEAVNLSQLKAELFDLEAKMAEENFWLNRKEATNISRQAADIKENILAWESIMNDVNEISELAYELDESNDKSLQGDVMKKFKDIEKRFASLEFFTLFKGKYDKNNAIIAIHAGSGGVDAQDWAKMLARMILRYVETKKFKTTILHESRGQEGGIKSIDIEISGNFAYGFLKSENGVHRLVRISPFDAEKMRHTSFALIEVLPELSDIDLVDTNINDNDLRVDVFRASGKGGQGVNTTDSAVRIVHIPTNITVTCQNERSQMQNKATALKYLKSKLHHLQTSEQQAKKDKIRGEYHEAAWGNQIRSYVLHPYKLVKDHRTNYEVQDVNNILDGNLDDFIESYLKSPAGQKGQ